MVGLGAVAFFTIFSNSITQVQKHFDQGVVVEAGISQEEMAVLGEQTFNGNGGCTVCHRIGSIGARAPDLAGIGSRAAERPKEAGYTGKAADAEGYIRESLVDPCGYVVEGYECIMPVINEPPTNLSPVEMALVIAYLQSLGGEITVALPEGDIPPEAAPDGQTAAEPAPTTPDGIVTAMACGICHTIPGLENAVGKVGPDLSAMESRGDATLRAQDYSGGAESVREYVRESILNPNVYLAQDCPTPDGGEVPCLPGIMPPNFGQRLTAQQLEVLVDYLASLKGP
jgi:cytochrome c2